jgi:hypothetical protein
MVIFAARRTIFGSLSLLVFFFCFPLTIYVAAMLFVFRMGYKRPDGMALGALTVLVPSMQLLKSAPH